MYIARCHYDKKDFAACKAALLKAMHIDPLNYKVQPGVDHALLCTCSKSFVSVGATGCTQLFAQGAVLIAAAGPWLGAHSQPPMSCLTEAI
jgi:hypothetical protein